MLRMIFENTTLVYKVGGNTKTNLYFKTKIQDVLYNALLSILVKFQKNSMQTNWVSVISKVLSFFGLPDITVFFCTAVSIGTRTCPLIWFPFVADAHGWDARGWDARLFLFFSSLFKIFGSKKLIYWFFTWLRMGN